MIRMRTKHCALLLGVVVASTSSIAHAGGILYVDDDAPAGGDGASWDTAYRFLQDALTEASIIDGLSEEIRIAQGEYKPDRDEMNPAGTGDREATFNLIAGVALRGGFAGLGARDPDARDFEKYETILSGDLNGDGVVKWEQRGDNSLHVLRAVSIDDAAELEGFTIEQGLGNVVVENSGAGIEIDGSNVRISNCAFRDNYVGYFGGAIFADSSSVEITECIFEDNYATYGGAIAMQSWSAFDGESRIADCLFESNESLLQAGALYIATPSIIESCTFRNNMTDESGGAVSAGNHVVFRNCLFEENWAGACGGAAEIYSSALLFDCAFRANVADQIAGAIRTFGTPGIVNCHFESNSSPTGGALAWISYGPTVVNCTFIANHATSLPFGEGGGAIFSFNSEPVILNSTFVANESAAFGGAIYTIDSQATVMNTAFIGNHAHVFGGAILETINSTSQIGNSIFLYNEASTGGGIAVFSADPIISNCILRDNACDQIGGDVVNVQYSIVEGGYEGEGNFDADPMFTALPHPGDDGIFGTGDDDFGDFRLQPGSPCIDAGTNELIANCMIDPDGHSRFADDPATPDTGEGRAPIVDLGAYEFASSPAVDCDGDAAFDTCTIAAGIVPDCNGNGIPDSCDIDTGFSVDCNKNGVPDACDIARGDSADCNGNAIPDECDIESSFSLDCNANGVPDDCDIMSGDSADCNGNAIPDECDIVTIISEDCNGNGIPDECDLLVPGADCDGNGQLDSCDLASGLVPDCNSNGVPDSCDVASGTSPDCNENGHPDECESTGPVDLTSPIYSPVDGPISFSYVIQTPLVAQNDVLLIVRAHADLGQSTESIHVDLNGIAVGNFFTTSFYACTDPPDIGAAVLSQDFFNSQIAAFGELVFTLDPTGAVDGDECDVESYMYLELHYFGLSPVNADGDGVPDICECIEDLDGDRVVGFGDLLLLLDGWGECVKTEGCPHDFDGSGSVGFGDLLLLLDAWGACAE